MAPRDRDARSAVARSRPPPDRRARFHYTAAVIARDELNDAELAVERFTRRARRRAVHAEGVRGDRQAAHRAQGLEEPGARVSPAAEAHRRRRAARASCSSCGPGSATSASITSATPRPRPRRIEVACELAPDDVAAPRAARRPLPRGRRGPPPRGDRASCSSCSATRPIASSSTRRSRTCIAPSTSSTRRGASRRRWCSSAPRRDEEKLLYERFRPAQFAPAPRRLTEELWQKSIIHPREDRHVGAIFASTLGALAGDAPRSRSPRSGSTPDARTDLDRDPRAVSRIVKYVAGVLAIDPAPMVWLQEGGDGLRVANTVGLGAERQQLVPSLLVGAPLIGKTDERELAFEVGKRMAYLRPERFVTLALGTLPKLEAAFLAAVLAGGARISGHDGTPFDIASDEAKKLAAHAAERRSRARCSSRSASCRQARRAGVGNGLISGWRTATDLTANRVGFIVCERPRDARAKGIATEGAGAVEHVRQGAPARPARVRGERAVLPGAPPPRPPRPRRGERVMRRARHSSAGSPARSRCSCGDGPPRRARTATARCRAARS